MNSFHLAEVSLAEPVSIYLPGAGPRPRVVNGGEPVPLTAETGTLTEIQDLQCAFWINVVTQTIHAQIARIPRPLLLYGPEDFAAVASDLPEHHGERVLQVLGTDPAATLQTLCNGEDLPPPPVRIPREIANWRARAILDISGLLPSVEASLAAMTGEAGVVVRTAWQSGAPLARRGPTVSALAPALGLTEEQVDSMFIAAATLDV
jgi:hypothetical protein